MIDPPRGADRWRALSPARRGGRSRGYALVSVLWTTALLSLIAAMLMLQARTAGRIEANAWSRLQAEAIVEAAVNRAALALLQARGGAPPRFVGAPIRFEFEGADIEIRIQDEFGKLDLNVADETRLRALLSAAGASPDQIEQVSETIARRRAAARPGQGPGRSGRAPAFQTVDELRLAPGMSPALFERVRPGLTVHSQSDNIDPHVAPELVLRALPHMKEDEVNAILASRPSSAEFHNGDGNAGPASVPGGRAFAIAVDAHFEGRRLQSETIIRLTGDPARPYWTLERRRF